MLKVLWGWGHSLKSYILMFDLKDSELAQPILDVGAAASSFNAEMNKRGYKVTSCDPLYSTPPAEIEKNITNLLDNLEKKVDAHKNDFYWEYVQDPAELMARQRAMGKIFVNDYPEGLAEKRYLPYALPTLPFKNDEFALSLCANFLFDGPHQDLGFQLQSIIEMCRVGREVRIFPLLNDQGQISENIGPIMAALQTQGYGVEVREVPFHLQKNGNAMLRVWLKECKLS